MAVVAPNGKQATTRNGRFGQRHCKDVCLEDAYPSTALVAGQRPEPSRPYGVKYNSDNLGPSGKQSLTQRTRARAYIDHQLAWRYASLDDEPFSGLGS
jgi:hypothetical protein